MPVIVRTPRPESDEATAPGNRQVVLALVLAVGLASAYAQRIVDPDLPGYLAYGRFFVQRGGPTATDVFSYTCQNCTWIHFEYLAHMSLWTAYSLGGAWGLIALKTAVGAAALFFTYATLSLVGRSPSTWLPGYLFVAGTVPRYFLFRPQLYTFALFAFFTYTLVRYLVGKRTHLWLLPPAAALWANCHGGFLAGLGAIGLAGLLRAVQALNRGDRSWGAVWAHCRGLCLVGAASTAFTLLNPQGWRLWSYVVLELTHGTNRRFIQEWMPLTFSSEPWSATAALLLACALCVATLAASSVRTVPHGVRPWQWLASCVPLVVLSLQSVRHVPIMVLWAVPVFTILADGAAPTCDKGRLRPIWTALRLFLAVPAGLTLVVCVIDPLPRIKMPAGSFGATAPYSAVSFLRANDLGGNVYVPLAWGSYFTWSLEPRLRVSMDGRNVSLYPDAMVTENLRFYRTGPFDLDAPLRYDTDFVIVPADRPVGVALRGDRRWFLLFEDRDCLIFVRADPSHDQIVTASKEGHLVGPPGRRPAVFQ